MIVIIIIIIIIIVVWKERAQIIKKQISQWISQIVQALK